MLLGSIGLGMNGTHQVMAYADDLNVIAIGIRTTEINAAIVRSTSNVSHENPIR